VFPKVAGMLNPVGVQYIELGKWTEDTSIATTMDAGNLLPQFFDIRSFQYKASDDSDAIGTKQRVKMM
tara:strand:+ start:402 stop:605 length:204 start_codon:yes stop_codon:yes gene_type:complete